MSFRVERIDWRAFTKQQWYELGKSTARGFEFDPLLKHVSGPNYSFSTLNFGSIIDPRERLETITKYERKIREWSRVLEVNAKTAGYDTYVIYDDLNNTAGMCQWKYPDHMISDLEKVFQRVGFWHNVKLWFLKQYYKLVNMIEFNFKESAVLNHRFLGQMDFMHEIYDTKRSDEATLAQIGDYDKVAQHVYPRNKTVYLFLFCVNNGYQGKGVGKQLMKEALDTIPSVDPVFEYNGQKSTGPQKFEMEATDMGSYLYSKYGFEKIIDSEAVKGDDRIHMTFMVKTRSE